MGRRVLGDKMGEQENIQENILAERYYVPGETSWDDLAVRVGKFIGGTAITTAMIEKKFIPASPFLMNAGTDHPQMFSCFVLPLEDTLHSIFGFYDRSATIFKSSGGVGANWSKLRPVGSPLSGGGTTSGVVSFMEIFNLVIEKVKQGGKKKGAAICTLDINHPEVEDFIRMKLERGKFENFNISPTVTDEFMRRAIAGHEKEKALFDLIVDCTYNSSEPGMLWIDTANRYCSTPGLGLYESTNPCGERFLFPFECCCLGGVNLAYFIRDGHVDWQNLGKTVRLIIRFLDESFDRNEYPLPEIREASQNTRRIGLYPIGLADALIKMKLSYGSQEGRDFAEKLWEFINKTAWDESVKLGEKLGTFPAYDSRNPELVPDGARNAAVTCVAPGGCQVKETMIMTESGILRLDEINPDSTSYQWKDVNLKVRVEKDDIYNCTKFYSNGLSKTIKLELHSGIPLECTENHRFRIFSNGKYEWRNASEIYEGDYVVTRIGGYTNTRTVPLAYVDKQHFNESDIILPTRLSPKVGEFLGILFGNGSIHKKGIRIHMNSLHTKKIERVCYLIETLFGITPHIEDRETRVSIYINSVRLLKWLEINGLLKDKSINAFIPKPIRCSSVKSLEAFINGLLMTDGCTTGKYNKQYIDTSSKQLAIELAICMRAIGKNARIKEYTNIKGRYSSAPSYRVHFVKSGSIGFKRYDKINNELKQNAMSLRNDYGEQLWLDRVESRSDSLSETFDISVDDAESYIGNSIVSHNTTSLIAGVNFGIEPYVGLVTRREQGSGKGTIVCPLFEEELRKIVSTEIEFNEVLDHAAKHGSIQSIDWLPADFKQIFVTARDIHWRDHIDMQTIFQKHCIDGTISKTINLPKSSTRDDIRDAYIYAWQQELRGLTFYREGTRDPVYAYGSGDEEEIQSALGPDYVVPAKAPAIRYNVKVGCGKMAVFVVGDPETGEPIELWQIPVSGGGCAGLNSGNGRAISKSLQYGVSPDVFIKSGEHVVCPACAGNSKLDGKSCPSAAARKLREYLKDSKIVKTYLKAHHEGTGLLVEKPKEKPVKPNECPACGWPLTHAEGCATCTKCGYSRCG